MFWKKTIIFFNLLISILNLSVFTPSTSASTMTLDVSSSYINIINGDTLNIINGGLLVSGSGNGLINISSGGSANTTLMTGGDLYFEWRRFEK